ncbi:MAG TPA: SDR family NAD(P)-dependent oxidoreductase [Steroidobacteraceae bacterium]|nr:SDR family NAD(P)-dependent oxidoreductase [Steroidobacteraceae bacterium]
MKDIAGKVAFITGAGSGIGLGMARVFHGAGMQVVITDLSQEHLDAALKLFHARPQGVHAIRLDVTDREAMVRAADEAERVFGAIHVLCNNAGVGVFGSLLEATYDDWDWALGVNVGGVVNGVQTFLPRMRAHGAGGHIVTTSSMSGLLARIGGIYAATKYALVGYMETLRAELMPHGIGVSVLCPGLVNTAIFAGENSRPARYRNTRFRALDDAVMREQVLPTGMDPMEVGKRVLRGISRNDLYILTHPEYEAGLRERFAAILASFPVEKPPARRVAASVAVLRNPMFAAERDRRLAERRKPKARKGRKRQPARKPARKSR